MALPTFTPGTVIRAQEMNDALATLFDMMYPVGSIYMSASLSTAEEVNNTLPGTWQEWGAGRVPVGVDPNDSDFNAPNKTGGSKTVTLTEAQMPKHHHGFKNANGAVVAPTIDQSNSTTWGASWSTSSEYKIANASGYEDKGDNQAHNNLQPYITCYMYKRIS